MVAVAEPEDAAPLTGEEHVPELFGHPRGLWYLAFTEAWERFSYYGMQSLLVLYLAFFAANTLVGWIGGFLTKMRTPTFWLLHAGLAAGAGLCFLIFKLAAGRTLAAEVKA